MVYEQNNSSPRASVHTFLYVFSQAFSVNWPRGIVTRDWANFLVYFSLWRQLHYYDVKLPGVRSNFHAGSPGACFSLMNTTQVRQQQVPRPLPRVRAAFSSFSPFHPTLANKWKLAVLIQVVSIWTQAVKLHKNFITSSIICTWTKKTFSANLQLDWINLYQNNFVSKQPETLTNMT